MTETSLRRAATARDPIYLELAPTTWDEALRNLHAFSDEGRISRSDSIPDGFSPFQSDVHTNPCLGWTEFRGVDVNNHIKRTRAQTPADFKSDETYYAIVYAYVSGRELEPDKMVEQLEYFHITGFLNIRFNPNNWLGSGVLVDFCDIVSLFERWWMHPDYRLGKELCSASEACYPAWPGAGASQDDGERGSKLCER